MSYAVENQIPPIETRTLRLYAALGAAGLLAFGVFCWIAANWSGFHRLTKLGMVGALLLAAALAAVVAPRLRLPALLVATAAVGGLLALIGQIYPSGADAWLLFAYWALLALPFALAARHDSVWTLWTLVAGAAIGLWRMQEHRGIAPEDFAPAWALALALSVALSPYLPLQRLIGRTVWSFRLASLGAVLMIASAGLQGLFMSNERGDVPLFASLGALGAMAVAMLALQPLELGVLTMVFAGVDALVIGRIFMAIAPNGPDIASALLIGAIAAGIVAGSVALLRALHARDGAQAPGAVRVEGEFSWPLAALSGFGAIVASIPFLALYALIFSTLLEKPEGAVLAGAATLAVSAFILRGGATFGFRQIFGMIGAVVGSALIAYAAIRWISGDAGIVLALVAAATAYAVPTRWARALFGFFSLSALTLSLYVRAFITHSEATVALTSALAAIGALALAAPSLGAGALLARARPFWAGWTAAGLLALVTLAGRPFLAGGGSDMLGEFSTAVQVPWNGPAQIASVALGLAGAALLLGRRTDLRTPLGFAAVAVAVALTLRSPTLGAVVVILACSLLAGSRSLAGASAVAALWIVSAFYYALTWPLTQKAYVLIGLGVALGGIALLTRANSHEAGARQLAPNMPAIALTLIGMVATSAAAGYAVRGAENILSNGRLVYIHLRPVDPRSLIQGDYMAVAFDTARLPAAGAVSGENMVLADIDARSVAKLASLAAPGATPQAGQILLRLRRKSGGWFVGSDAFFFEEGHADDFAGARYGVFRVGADGRLLLIGLTDENLRRLP